MVQTYKINHNWFDEGGCCQVYNISHDNTLIFKEFFNKHQAYESYKIQKLLCEYDLAPKIYSEVCQLKFDSEDMFLPDSTSNWGYTIEKASCVSHTKKSMRLIQTLVEQIEQFTGLKFWDCHWYNVGFVSRKEGLKLVCIDTGKESFNQDINAWGLFHPGPKCRKCNYYYCKCV